MKKKIKPLHTYIKNRRESVYRERVIPNKKKQEENKRKKITV